MGVGKRQQEVRAMRGQMRSPGQLVAGRDVRVRFWEAIARGASSEDAAGAAGVSPAVGSRWFRQAGGMTPISLAPLHAAYIQDSHQPGNRATGNWVTLPSEMFM